MTVIQTVKKIKKELLLAKDAISKAKNNSLPEKFELESYYLEQFKLMVIETTLNVIKEFESGSEEIKKWHP